MKRSDASKVTVLMPVFNGMPYLAEAIQSVLNQTFSDFEFIIIDDGSTDDSVAVIEGFHDSRIHLHKNATNSGLVASLNWGLELAQGELIARMDADDVCLPERLARQVAFMEAHKEIGICGTWFEIIGGFTGQIVRYPIDPDTIKCTHIFGPALAHPSVMIRRELLNKIGQLYDPLFSHAEDYELWVRASEYTLFANIGEILMNYRLHSHQVGHRHKDEQIASAGKVRLSQIYNLGIIPSDEEFNIHQSISQWNFVADREFIVKTEKWLIKLIDVNKRAKVYPELPFSAVLCERWFEACDALTELGPWLFKKFMSSSLTINVYISRRRRLGFFMNCLLRR